MLYSQILGGEKALKSFSPKGAAPYPPFSPGPTSSLQHLFHKAIFGVRIIMGTLAP